MVAEMQSLVLESPSRSAGGSNSILRVIGDANGTVDVTSDSQTSVGVAVISIGKLVLSDNEGGSTGTWLSLTSVSAVRKSNNNDCSMADMVDKSIFVVGLSSVIFIISSRASFSVQFEGFSRLASYKKRKTNELQF